MPVIECRWSDRDRRWLVELPGGIVVSCRDADTAKEMVARHASGAAIRWHRATAETEAELRFAHGDR